MPSIARRLGCSVVAVVCVVALGAGLANAQTAAAPTTGHATKHRRHILHPGISSAPARNVGPTSSSSGPGVAGESSASGLPSNPGAPSAGNSGAGGK